MNANVTSSKWVIIGVAAVALTIGYMAGRFTTGTDSVLPFASGKSKSSADAGASWAGNSNLGGGASSHQAGSDDAVRQPTGGYTKESLIEAAKELSLAGGLGPQKLRQMLAVQELLSQQDVKTLVEELMADKSPEAAQALYLAMGVLAEKSPTEALDMVITQSKSGNQQMAYGIYQAVATSVNLDPEGTLAKLQSIEDNSIRTQAISVAIGALAAKDPEQALNVYLNTDTDEARQNSIYMIYHQWGRKDPLAAAASLSRITDNKKREQAMGSLVQSWSMQDPAAAWKWAQSQPPVSESHQDPRVQAINGWARKDPLAALAAAQSLESAALRQQTIPQVIRNWAQTDPEAALSWITSQDNPTDMEDAFRQISYSDTVPPEKLFNIVMEKMPAGNAFRNTVSQVISRWADKDPEAAAAALQTLPPGDAYNNSARNLGRQWAKKDPAAAFNWIRSLPQGTGRSNTLSSWFSEVSKTDWQMAQDTYTRLPQQDQDKVAYNMASSLASEDPASAVRFSSSLTNERIKKRVQESVARTWARNDPEGAGAWALTLPEKEQGRVISNVVDAWADKNVEAAAAWLASMPAGPRLDEATRTLSRELNGVDPEAAISWAGSITDEKLRDRAVYDAAREWIRNDPATGKAWVQRSNLADKQKEKLLK